MIQNHLTASAPVFFESIAWGKAILFGEHSVVYGGVAAALPLKDLPLKVRLSVPNSISGSCTSLDSRQLQNYPTKDVRTVIHWELRVCNERWEMTADQHKRLDDALCLAFKLTDQTPPDLLHLQVDSLIPLGGGLGGSAALSSAFLRIAYQMKHQCVNPEVSEDTFLKMANELDGHFHGKASGLDVAAVNSIGPIGFESGKSPWLLDVTFPFRVILVDTGIRTATAQMVQEVRSKIEDSNKTILNAMSNLKDLGFQCRDALKFGNVTTLGALLNLCQIELNRLGVSHDANNDLCTHLRSMGCLGAKLTGGGGGGMVLGLLPIDLPLPQFSSDLRIFSSEVTPSANPR